MRQCAQAALAIASLTLCLTAGNSVAEAQVRGIPVNNSGVASGIALYGDVGFPDEEAGKGTARAAVDPAALMLVSASLSARAQLERSVPFAGNLRRDGNKASIMSAELCRATPH